MSVNTNEQAILTDTVCDTADLFTWLPEQPRGMALVTMLPDAAELGMTSMVAYRGWLRAATDACLTNSAGPTVFAQTDRLYDGHWFDKAALIIGEAADELLWHKIILRRDPGATDLHRPTFTHLIAFGPGRPGRRCPDVIDGGWRRWTNGVGEGAARFVADWMHEVGVTACLNPCYGAGTFADALIGVGITVRGCDIAGPRR